MESLGNKFDLHSTLVSIGQAVLAVVCHMLFNFAAHGLIMSVLLALLALVLVAKRHRFGQPLLAVSRRIAMVCLLLTLPGSVCLVIFGKLPEAGVFNVNSLGFIALWSLICLHLSFEEINHSQSKV